MAVKTFLASVTLIDSSVFAAMIDGSPDQTAGNRADGWTVAKLAAGQSANFAPGTKVGTGNFTTESTTPRPPAGSVSGVAWKTPATLNGTFAAGNWVFTFAVRATTAASQAGRVRLRVYRSPNANSTGSVEVTSAAQVGTTTAALTTSADGISTVTWNAPQFTVTNEYLFIAVAWEITTASGNNNGDVVFRTGQAAGGTRFVTTDLSAGTPISGTDSISGMATESAAITKIGWTSTDLTGPETEATTIVAQVSTSDPTGPEVETANVAVPISTSEAIGPIASESASYQITAQSITTYDPASIQTLQQIPQVFATYSVLPATYATYADLQIGLPPMPALNEVASVTQAFSTTDANGTTTESASIRIFVTDSDSGTGSDVATQQFLATVTDANGVTTEFAQGDHKAFDTNGVTTEATKIDMIAADANGAITESVSAIAKITGTDSGTISDIASVSTQQFFNSSDANGTTSESASLSTQISATDSGTSSEIANLVTQNNVSSSDANGPTTESASFLPTLSSVDSGTISEAQSLVVKHTVTDANGISSESAAVNVSALTSADSGTISEIASAGFLAASTDSGTISETAALAPLSFTVTDSGTISEAASPRFITVSADVGGASEAAAFTFAASGSDVGGSSETGSVIVKITATDSGIGSDTGTTGAPLLTSDSGSSSELGMVGVQVSSADLATASEAVSSLVTPVATDSGGITAETFRIGLSASEGGGTPFSPPNLSGLNIWLDASQLAVPVEADITTWPNLAAGGATPMMPGLPLPVPRMNGPVGQKVVRFFINGGRLRIVGIGAYLDYTLVYIGRIVSGGTPGRVVSSRYPDPNHLIGFWNGYQDVAYTTTGDFYDPDTRTPVVYDQWKLYSADMLSTPSFVCRFYSDGTFMGQNSGGTPGISDGWGVSGLFNISGYADSVDETCDCEVAEVIMYNRRLTGVDRQTVEAYMRNKWMLGVSGVPAFPGLSEVASIKFADVDVATVAEAVTLIESSVAVDSNSLTSETASAKAVIVATDSGGSSEIASAVNKGGDSDAGGISETTSLKAVLAATVDTNGIVGETGLASTQNQKADIDSGIVSESATVNAPLQASDSGTISESVSAMKVSGTVDLATINETALLTVKVTTADSGGDSESGLVVAVVVSSDIGGIVETTTVTKNVSDFATGTDTEFLHAFYQDQDTGTGSEGQNRWPPALTFTDIPAGVILEMAMGTFGTPAVGVAREPAKPRGTYVTPVRGRIL